MTVYVVVDTGVLVHRTRLLSTALGAAFLYSLSRTGYKIALPEVIELEVAKHTEILVREAISMIDEGYRTIEVTMGSRDDYKVPTEELIENRVIDRFDELNDLIVRIPFTFDHAKSALLRVLGDVPPNRPKDQQFKDSAIWEAVIDASTSADVHFVSEDKSFFEDRDPKKGVASELQDDIDRAENRIFVHYGLDEYLGVIRDEIPALDEVAIARAIAESLVDQLLERAASKGFQRGSLASHRIEAFVTERPQMLAIKFQLEFEVFDVPYLDMDETADGIEAIEGNCSFNTGSGEVADIQLDSISIRDFEGKQIPGHGHAFIRAGSITLGRGRISHRILEPLPRPDKGAS